jgi:hypothetical protein
VVLFLPPLVLRGALVRWTVDRATRDLCGTVRIDDAHVGWLAVVDILRGRPFSVELRGARVTGPEGDEVLRAASITTDVAIARNPWRVVVNGGVASRGSWRLAVDPAGRVGGLLGAFRVVPEGATKAACLQPAAPRRGSRPPSTPSASLELRGVRLDDVDVDLDFPVWGLFLPRVHAVGSLALGTPGGAGFTFDVRDATAPGGALRAGPGGTRASAATTTAHFDDVAIAHVGVSLEDPGDLVLTVTRADTGRSRLQGNAVFTNVFARHGKRGDRNPPGLILDARWDRLADAAARLDARWLPRETMGELLDGALVARLRGPFLALSGAVSIEGPRVSIEASIEEGKRASLEARANDVALTPFLHRSLQPTLRGHLTGHLRVNVALLAGPRDVDVEIPSAEVTVTRASPSAIPRRLAFHIGPSAKTVARAGTDTLAVGLASASLRHRKLRLEGLVAHWAELSARGVLTLAMPAAAGDGTEAPAQVDAKLEANLPSIERWVRPDLVGVRATAALTLSGPLDHLRARVAFTRASEATILSQSFRVPAPLTATFDDGRGIAFDGLVLEHVGGGRLTGQGRAGRDGRLSGQLTLSGYPLAEVPGMESVVLPAALGNGRPTTLHDALEGQLNATLQGSGVIARPVFEGKVDLVHVALLGRTIGEGSVHAHTRGLSLTAEGTLGPSVALNMNASLRDAGAVADVKLALTKLALAPWLPPALSGLDVSVSGLGQVTVAPDRPFATHAELEAAGPAGQLAIEGRTSNDTAAVTARGRLELGGLRSLWGRALADAQGTISVDVTSTPEARLKGALAVARAVTVRPKGWPVSLGVAEGGRVEIDETHLHVPDLTLTAPGARLRLAGEVNADLVRPERTTIDLQADAHLDAAELARQARLPELASASGTISVDVHARGALDDPTGTAVARVDGVELRPSSKAWPALRVDGVVNASEHTVSTRGVRVATLGPAPVTGVVTVGAPAAPASARVTSAFPLRLERVDVPVTARGLRVGDAKSSFAIGALDLDLRLAGVPERALVLSGDVGVADAHFDPFAGNNNNNNNNNKKKPAGPARPWFESLPPWLTLDLTIHGPPDAITVDVPVLWDVDLGMRCRVTGSKRGGTISGQVRGSGLYSRLMLSLFGPKGARECHLLKE